MSISVVINTLNEEASIRKCIESVGWASEVVVIDNYSTDRTVDIAESLGAKVYMLKPAGFVEASRNFGINKAVSPWILILDADEIIPKPLGREISRIINNPLAADAYYIAEKNIVFGKWVKGNALWPDYHPRLFKKGHVEWESKMHFIPTPKGTAEHISPTEDLAIHHYSKSYLTVDGFISAYNKYSAYEVQQLEDSPYTFKRRHIITIFYKEFKFRFVTHRGFVDGFNGFVIAYMFAFFKTVALLKLWEKEGFKDYQDQTKGALSYLIRILRNK